jgi:hypothetical protein
MEGKDHFASLEVLYCTEETEERNEGSETRYGPDEE